MTLERAWEIHQKIAEVFTHSAANSVAGTTFIPLSKFGKNVSKKDLFDALCLMLAEAVFLAHSDPSYEKEVGSVDSYVQWLDSGLPRIYVSVIEDDKLKNIQSLAPHSDEWFLENSRIMNQAMGALRNSRDLAERPVDRLTLTGVRELLRGFVDDRTSYWKKVYTLLQLPETSSPGRRYPGQLSAATPNDCYGVPDLTLEEALEIDAELGIVNNDSIPSTDQEGHPEPYHPNPVRPPHKSESPKGRLVFEQGHAEAIPKKSTVIDSICFLAYYLTSGIQIFAVWALAEKLYDLPSVVSFILAALLSFIPLIGSVLAVIGSVVCWGWVWWHAALLYLWWLVLALVVGGLMLFIWALVSLFSKFAKKKDVIDV
jgi:hypothetical protein